MPFVRLTCVVTLLCTIALSNGVQHSFDLASNMPDHLAIMFSMSWFGIPSSDPQGAGPDTSYGNWEWGGKCVPTNNPATCNDIIGSEQRWVASKRRPLAGIYSSSARDSEGLARVDLMLSNIRRPCDDGAKLDAWCVQMDGIQFTSRYPKNHQATTSDLAYRAMLAFFNEAQAANMNRTIVIGQDATWYFNFGNDYGLGKCDNSKGNPKQNCIDALQSDLIDMIEIGKAYDALYTINGKPFVMYFVAGFMTTDEWNTMFNTVRSQLGVDFYALANSYDPSLFAAFDALAPWTGLGQWASATGSTNYTKGYNWAQLKHEALFNGVGNYPGRVVFGSVNPGFDDYTEDWGQCKPRFIPRDAEITQGVFAYLTSKNVKGVWLETWDDWTEGTHIEPDVVGGPSVLVGIKQGLGSLYNEPPDPSGDQRLENRWNTYGQARNCNGGHHGTPPVIDLKC